MQICRATGNKLKSIDLLTAAGKSKSQQANILAIVLQFDGYSFCTATSDGMHLHRLYAAPYPAVWPQLNPTEQWSWLVQQHEELHAPYEQIKIAYDSPRLTLLPSAIYRDGTGTDYFELVHGPVANEQLHRDSLQKLEIELIAAFPIGWIGAAQLQFRQPAIRSSAACLTERFSRTSAGPSKVLYLQLSTEQLGLWQFENNRLLAHNQYFAPATEDVLYYSSLLAKENDYALFLLGDAQRCAAAQALLERYYAAVQLLPTEAMVPFDAQLASLLSPNMQSLLACLCAS
jgi:hypothetical protein